MTLREHRSRMMRRIARGWLRACRPVSECCSAIVLTVPGEIQGTLQRVCDKCGKPCDIARPK